MLCCHSCIYADPAHWRSGITIDISVDGLILFYLDNVDLNGCERLATSGNGIGVKTTTTNP